MVLSPAVDIALVRRAMQMPLPGFGAQRAMAPRPRIPVRMPPIQYKDGGVLLLLFPRGGALHVVLTRRCDHLAAHAGQISFPGGLCERADRCLAETALRETREELGLDLEGLEVLGELSPLEIPVSGYRIHPWVAYAPAEPVLRPDPREVAELLEVPLVHFFDPQMGGLETRVIRGYETEVPFYRVGEHKVWGATAMVLSEFVALLRSA